MKSRASPADVEASMRPDKSESRVAWGCVAPTEACQEDPNRWVHVVQRRRREENARWPK
jgi:hypothetical protein